jgi:NitT/TauT family transport system substrate-binding protein
MMKKYLLLGCLMALILSPISDKPAQAQNASGVSTLKVALLPIVDTLPFYAAESMGALADAGLQVTVVPVSSALERDQLMQSGQIEVMLNEISGAAVFNRHQVQIKVVAIARESMVGFPLFRILAAPGCGLRGPLDLAGIPIGVSINTVIEYVTYRVLSASGLGPSQIAMQSVPSIPERYQLLMQGQLKAATLPDPLAISAVQAGAVKIADDAAYPQFSLSVLSVSQKALIEKPQAVRLFLKAWDQAAARLNESPEKFTALMLKHIQVPPNVRQTYRIPPFARGKVPAPAQWSDMMDWMIHKGLLDRPLPYEDSVTVEFLPQGKAQTPNGMEQKP